MFCPNRYATVVGVLFVSLSLFTEANEKTVLELKRASEIAMQADPWLRSNSHAEQALKAMSISESALPDPRVMVSIANLGADTLNFDQEETTQLKFGVSQVFPRGDSRQIKRQRLETLSQQFPFQREDRRARVALNTAMLWLDAFYAQKSISLIEGDRALFEQIAETAEASYSSAMGSTRQQDIIRGQLELTRLDDRLSVLQQSYDAAYQGLQKWLQYYSNGFEGKQVQYVLPSELPNLKQSDQIFFDDDSDLDHQRLYEIFLHHPKVKAMEKKIAASKESINLAKQNYRPQWGIDLAYAHRDNNPNGNKRADFLTFGLSFDLPLNSERKQDKQMNTAIENSLALETELWSLLREMIAEFEIHRVQYRELGRRQDLYRERLLPQMHDQAEASLTAYTHDDGDFAEVIRSRISELNALIDSLKIDVERQKHLLQMNYFFIQEGHEVLAGSEKAGSEKIASRKVGDSK